MLNMVVNMVDEMLTEIPDLEIYWEWPKSAEGWKLYVVDRKLKEILEKHGKTIYNSYMDGCRYDMKTEEGDKFIRKSWRILNTDARFHQLHGRKTCNQNLKCLQPVEVHRLFFYDVCRQLSWLG